MLDVIGTTPTPDEVEDFLADPDPEKRTSWSTACSIAPNMSISGRSSGATCFASIPTKLGRQGMLAFNLWLREAFRANMPVNRMVDELVTAQGSIYSNGPANYFRIATGPDDLAETTAQVFMGVRLQCAKCHHHPFEAYGQDDYYALAAYFARVKTKSSDEFGLFGREQVVYVAEQREVRQPRTGKTMAPRPLGGDAGRRPGRSPPRPGEVADRRESPLAGQKHRQPLLGLPDGQGAGQSDRRPARDQSPDQPRAARRAGRGVHRVGLRPQGTAPLDPHQPRLPVERTGHARQPARHDVLHALHDQAA